MNNERVLREKALEAIGSGKLPARKQDRILGGVGTGKTCALCGELLTLTQMEIEAEFKRQGSTSGSETYYLHPRCFTAWESEILSRLAQGAASNPRDQPPPSHWVTVPSGSE